MSADIEDVEPALSKSKFARTFVLAVAAAVIAISLLLPDVARAQAAACSQSNPAPIATPIAMTLSGGVSLGAYQAGSLAFTSEVLKQNPDRLKLKLLTGASAGALNALIAVLSSCEDAARNQIANFSESDFYHAWVDFKGGELLAQEGEDRGLLSRRAFAGIVTAVEKKWKQGLPRSCDVVLGLSVTRVKSLEDPTQLGIKRQAEKITLRIRGQGHGRAPLLTNYVNPSLSPRPILLALTPGDDVQNFAALRDVLFASAAFPLAFAPQKLRTCVSSATERWQHADLPFTCSESEIEEAEFLDGGLLDNKPLALAERLARTGLEGRSCDDKRWREIPSTLQAPLSSQSASDDVVYLYSDLSATSYRNDDETGARDSGVLKLTSLLIGDVLNSSQNQDSASLFDQSPRLHRQIAPLTNSIPRLGDSLLGFFGFLERDFRSFDFYLGAWEAREFLRASTMSNLNQPKLPAGSLDEKKLSCMDASFKRHASAHALCDAVGDERFAILVDLSLARLAAKRTDLGFVLSYLADRHYAYRDLGLSTEESRRAPEVIKSASMGAILKLASAQPGAEGYVLSTVGPLVFNLLEPLPNHRDLSITFGVQSLVSVSTIFDVTKTHRTRWTYGVGVENVDGWLGPDGGKVIATPFLGLEIEPDKLNTSLLQTRFSLSGGYRFGDALEMRCENASKSPRNCRGIAVRAGGSLTLIERLKFQTEFEILPFQKSGPTPWRLVPSLGLQFYF